MKKKKKKKLRSELQNKADIKSVVSVKSSTEICKMNGDNSVLDCMPEREHSKHDLCLLSVCRLKRIQHLTLFLHALIRAGHGIGSQ